MKKFVFILALLLSLPLLSSANDNSVTMKLTPSGEIEEGKTIKVELNLIDKVTNKTLTEDDLKVAHTKKLHLLVIEPTLQDYQHIHPAEGKTPGEFSFDFTPKKFGTYRFFADIIPLKTDKQEYVIADLGKPVFEKISIDKSKNNEAEIEGYKFKLVFDSDLRTNMATMGTLTVADENGKPVDYLEPVMGAYAHIVAFSEDYSTIVHIHPMGVEPEKETDRGGPELQFHIEPATSGFVKLFAQFRIKGKDIFVPFGLDVGNALAMK